MEIYVDGEQIILKKYEPACVFCGYARDVVNNKWKNIWSDCMKELSEEEPEVVAPIVKYFAPDVTDLVPLQPVRQ